MPIFKEEIKFTIALFWTNSYIRKGITFTFTLFRANARFWRMDQIHHCLNPGSDKASTYLERSDHIHHWFNPAKRLLLKEESHQLNLRKCLLLKKGSIHHWLNPAKCQEVITSTVALNQATAFFLRKDRIHQFLKPSKRLLLKKGSNLTFPWLGQARIFKESFKPKIAFNQSSAYFWKRGHIHQYLDGIIFTTALNRASAFFYRGYHNRHCLHTFSTYLKEGFTCAIDFNRWSAFF